VHADHVVVLGRHADGFKFPGIEFNPRFPEKLLKKESANEMTALGNHLNNLMLDDFLNEALTHLPRLGPLADAQRRSL